MLAAGVDSYCSRQAIGRQPTDSPAHRPAHPCRGQSSPYQPAISPEPVAHLAQHRLLPLLVDAALKEPNIDLRMGHRCVGLLFEVSCCMGFSGPMLTEAVPVVCCSSPSLRRCLPHCGCSCCLTRPACSLRSFTQSPSGIAAVVDAAAGSPSNGSSSTAPGGIYRLSGQYLAACDGARGGLRQQLGVGMGGPGAIQHLINIHFISPQVWWGGGGGCVSIWFLCWLG